MTEPLALFDAEETLEAVRTGRYDTYPAYKPSGVEWLGDVPEHWDVKRLKWSSPDRKGGVWGEEPDDEDTGIICIRVADFDRTNLRVRIQNPTLRSIPTRDLKGRLLKRGDLLLEKSGGGEKQLVGSVMLFDHEVQAVNSNFVSRMTPSPGYDSHFLAYLHSCLYSSRINFRSIKQTTGIQNLDVDAYLSERVAFPTLEEQRAISRFLDEQTEKIDDLISAKRDLLALLKEKRQAVITHAVTRGLDPTAKLKSSGVEWLGDVPEHWVPKKLGYLANMRGGSTPSKSNEEFWRGDIPWVSPKDMKSLVIKDSKDHISESALEETNLGLLKPPAILMVVRGMILAHSFPVGITTTPVTINQDMKALTPRGGISSEYLLHLLNGISKVVLGAVDDSAHGTRVLRISVWKHITVYLPEEQEQKAICDYVNKAHDKYDRMIAEVQTAVDRLHEYRASIISAAVTGKIDVRGEGL